MSGPPPLILFDGEWPVYEERLYEAFLDTLVRRAVTFRGWPVKPQYRPSHRGKGFSFWHVISEAPDPRNRNEDDRIPGLRRCERIRWIAWVIECASNGEPGFHWWENRRGRDRRVVIWAEKHDFAVVLARRKGYYVLKTAYSGIRPHQRQSFMAERDAFWRAQKG